VTQRINLKKKEKAAKSPQGDKEKAAKSPQGDKEKAAKSPQGDKEKNIKQIRLSLQQHQKRQKVIKVIKIVKINQHQKHQKVINQINKQLNLPKLLKTKGTRLHNNNNTPMYCNTLWRVVPVLVAGGCSCMLFIIYSIPIFS